MKDSVCQENGKQMRWSLQFPQAYFSGKLSGPRDSEGEPRQNPVDSVSWEDEAENPGRQTAFPKTEKRTSKKVKFWRSAEGRPSSWAPSAGMWGNYLSLEKSPKEKLQGTSIRYSNRAGNSASSYHLDWKTLLTVL